MTLCTHHDCKCLQAAKLAAMGMPERAIEIHRDNIAVTCTWAFEEPESICATAKDCGLGFGHVGPCIPQHILDHVHATTPADNHGDGA